MTILIGQVVFNASVAMLIIRARFVGMGDTLEEAAYDLGSGPLATFRQVTLPRLMPAIVAAALLSFTFSFDDYVAAGVHERHHQHLADRAVLGRPLRPHARGQRPGHDHARHHPGGGDSHRRWCCAVVACGSAPGRRPSCRSWPADEMARTRPVRHQRSFLPKGGNISPRAPCPRIEWRRDGRVSG